MWYDATVAAGLLEADDSDVRGKNGYAPAPVERTRASGWLWSWALATLTSSSKADLAWRYISWATGPQYVKEAGTRIAGGWAAIPAGTRRSTYAIPEYKKAARAFAEPELHAIESAPVENPGTTQAARQPGRPIRRHPRVPGRRRPVHRAVLRGDRRQGVDRFGAQRTARPSRPASGSDLKPRLPRALRQNRPVPGGLAVRPRQIAPVALILALTVAGFIVARVLAERDARRDSEHRAEVAAAQIRGRVAQAASLTESLRRFMLDASGTGVTSDEFARNALRWLSPAGFPAAAWVEQVPDSRRAAYERRTGQPIVTPDERHRVVPPDRAPPICRRRWCLASLPWPCPASI